MKSPNKWRNASRNTSAAVKVKDRHLKKTNYRLQGERYFNRQARCIKGSAA